MQKVVNERAILASKIIKAFENTLQNPETLKKLIVKQLDKAKDPQNIVYSVGIETDEIIDGYTVFLPKKNK